MACCGRPGFTESFGVREGRRVLRRDLGGGRDVLKQFIDIVKVRHKFKPEGHLGSTVVVSNSRLQANVKVQLIFGVVLGPGHFFKPIGFCVDELGVLWDWLIWISIEKKR